MKIGRFDSGYDLALTIDVTLGTETGNVAGVLIVGDYTIYATSTDSTHSSVFDHVFASFGTSVWETTIQSGSEVQNEKQDQWVAVSTAPLAGTIQLKTRKDSATTFTSVFTENTAGSLYHRSRTLADNTELPKYYENTYQITSTGGAIITGIEFETIEYPSKVK